MKYRSKYGNKKITIDNIKFDSKKESEFYIQLKILLKAKKITGFERQVVYNLLPSQKRYNKHKERPVKYTADFVVSYPNGVKVVYDVKGFRTKEYIIKRKLMLWIHNIQIEEI